MTFDITAPATYIPLIAGVIIPFFVALLAKANATGLVKSLLAALGAALTALAVYLENPDHVSWAGAASAFVFALIVAAASRVALTGGADDKVNASTANFGVGTTNPHKP